MGMQFFDHYGSIFFLNNIMVVLQKLKTGNREKKKRKKKEKEGKHFVTPHNFANYYNSLKF